MKLYIISDDRVIEDEDLDDDYVESAGNNDDASECDDLECDHDCRMENGEPKCFCDEGFKLDGTACVGLFC